MDQKKKKKHTQACKPLPLQHVYVDTPLKKKYVLTFNFKSLYGLRANLYSRMNAGFSVINNEVLPKKIITCLNHPILRFKNMLKHTSELNPFSVKTHRNNGQGDECCWWRGPYSTGPHPPVQSHHLSSWLALFFPVNI